MVTDFWAHYKEPLISLPQGALTAGAQGADFKTGTVFPASASQLDASAVQSNLTTWLGLLEQYPGLISTWDIPYPVPKDLLISFGEYVKKYNIPLVATLANELGQGMGNILALPAMYVLKSFDAHQARALLDQPFLVNPTGNTQSLYNKVRAELGKHALLETCVDKIVRSKKGVLVSVTTPSGPKIIKGKKLVVTVPPLLKNLGFLDLDHQEQALYARFNNSYYWNAVVNNTGLPTNATYSNADPLAPYFIPALPGAYTIQSVAAIPGLFQVYFGSTTNFTIEQVESNILATIARVRKSQNLPEPAHPTKVIRSNSHNPFFPHVETKDIADGFYAKWLALQGHKNTWWNGIAMVKPASYPIWNFTETLLLPELMRK